MISAPPAIVASAAPAFRVKGTLLRPYAMLGSCHACTTLKLYQIRFSQKLDKWQKLFLAKA